jgi:hypothetical protein
LTRELLHLKHTSRQSCSVHGVFKNKVWSFVAGSLVPPKELRWSRRVLTSPRAVREISHSSLLAGRGRLIAFPNRPLEKSGVQSLSLRNIWRPWGSFRLSWTFSSVGGAAADLYIRRAFPLMGASLFATVAVIASLATTPAPAGDATWSLSPPNEDFNDPVNWGPPPTGAVGVPTGTAFFGASSQTTPLIEANTSLNQIEFTSSAPPPPASVYTIGVGFVGLATLTLNGPGVTNLSSNVQGIELGLLGH